MLECPIIVQRGDWLWTKSKHSKLTLKLYDGPPPTGKQVAWQHRPNFYIGPVHDWAVEGHSPPEMHGITLLFLPNALSVHANVTVWLSIAILRVGPFLCGYQWLANC